MPSGFFTELGMTWREVALTIVTTTAVYSVMILFSRLFGQRQFAMSSAYDLAFVFAMGSLVGRVILVRVLLLTAVVGLLMIFALHASTSWLHHNVTAVHRLVQNRPIVLVADGSLDAVHAIVLERNGAMSVLAENTRVDASLFAEVVGSDHLTNGAERGPS